MSKTQTSKHEIPKDWLKITDKEAIKRLNYLLIHYKEYNIEKQGNSIIIDGMSISPRVIPTLGTYFAIGYPVGVYWSSSPVYQLIEWLYNLCKTEAEKREQKAEKREQKAETKAKNAYRKGTIINVIGCCFTVIVLVAGTYAIVKLVNMGKQERAKQIKIENEIKRYEKTLPYYNEYLQTKQQIQNRRDSLEKVY